MFETLELHQTFTNYVLAKTEMKFMVTKVLFSEHFRFSPLQKSRSSKNTGHF